MCKYAGMSRKMVATSRKNLGSLKASVIKLLKNRAEMP